MKLVYTTATKIKTIAENYTPDNLPPPRDFVGLAQADGRNSDDCWRFTNQTEIWTWKAVYVWVSTRGYGVARGHHKHAGHPLKRTQSKRTQSPNTKQPVTQNGLFSFPGLSG